ncbi:hypothetical protein CVT24_009402 [Panaeolus cyanescens]|uniref:Uncharacterized protein n=1 Tax=Panaeolus cyanescens TaxID=181874 RepID=A0A409VAU9_9AGAR|nr:hypothetical protein CVT24_009402 [Panaeolus cyanescens]
MVDWMRISKRDHRARRSSKSPSSSSQSSEFDKRQGNIIDNLLAQLCRQNPNLSLCKLLPTSRNPNPPRTTSTRRDTPRPTSQAPNPNPNPAPSPTPTTNPNTNPAPSPSPPSATTPVVNAPATPSTVNRPPNTTSPVSRAPVNSSGNVSQTVAPIDTSKSSSTSLSVSTDSPNLPPSASDTAGPGPQASAPFGTDPLSTAGVGVGGNSAPGATDISNTSAANSGTNAGPIIGGILGAVFLVLIILAGLVWYRQKRNREHRVAPSAEFMNTNKRYPFAGQGQQGRMADPETRSMGNTASIGRTDSPRSFLEIRRGS